MGGRGGSPAGPRAWGWSAVLPGQGPGVSGPGGAGSLAGGQGVCPKLSHREAGVTQRGGCHLPEGTAGPSLGAPRGGRENSLILWWIHWAQKHQVERSPKQPSASALLHGAQGEPPGPHSAGSHGHAAASERPLPSSRQI